MTDQTLANEDTGTSENNTQAATSKTYTQDEVNDMMARMKGSIAKKYEKKFEDLGDIDELRALKTEAEKRQQAEQIKRGEFEKTLQELAGKKDAEIAKRDTIIREYKVNTPLLSAAAKYKAVNADQVKALLINSLRLTEDGDVAVVDDKGNTRYTDSGTSFSVDDLVQEFLQKNPHFVQPTPSTTMTRSNVVADSNGKVDITKLDMKNPKDRELYKKYRTEHGIA
jgi:tyrosyl-tRNA synthetase